MMTFDYTNAVLRCDAVYNSVARLKSNEPVLHIQISALQYGAIIRELDREPLTHSNRFYFTCAASKVCIYPSHDTEDNTAIIHVENGPPLAKILMPPTAPEQETKE